jgi:hypothetical protein
MLFGAFRPQTTREIKKVTASERSRGICSSPYPPTTLLEVIFVPHLPGIFCIFRFQARLVQRLGEDGNGKNRLIS